MMADTGRGRMLATKVIFPAQGYNRGTGGRHEDAGHFGRERNLSVGQREKGGDEQKSAQPTTITVVEQWLCFILGLICMAFGVCGICMKPEQVVLSASIAWLGSLYMPMLRVTAVVCIGLGVILARRGWAHL